jgi:phosphoglucosamine mutase
VSAAAVISASHNPYQDNGIKFFSHKGTKLSDKLEARIEKFIKSGVSATKLSNPNNIKRKPLMVEEYKTFLRNSFSKSASIKGMKLVVDCANGATSALANEIFSGLGVVIVPINCSPSGININKDCGSLHPYKLKQEVLKNKAYCGLAFDGDGDRINFVDEKGIVRDGDYLLAIASLHMKEKGLLKNNLLVTTVMANLGLYRAMEKLGIETRQTPVGDRYVFEEMVRSGAVIGGEQSGHIIFKDYLPTGDGMLSALQILGIAGEKRVPFSRLCSIIEKYPQVLINTKVSRKIPVEKLGETSALIKNAEKMLGKEGRILVRYSGTENLIRVMIEGRDKKEINEMAQNISETAKREIDK